MRRPISSQKRYAILERDDFRCQVCGAAAPNVTLHVDHIVAVARGGTNDDSDLRAICVTCNLGKGSQPVRQKPAAPTVRYPIRISHNEVHVRGEPLCLPVFWIGAQWAVTAFGVECRDGRYPIAKDRLFEDLAHGSWERHMGEKAWVDIDDLKAALEWARENIDLLDRTPSIQPEAEDAA